MEKLILTDCDGVLLDWETGFIKYAKENGLHYIPGNEQYYNLAKRFEEDWDEVIECVTKFNSSEAMTRLEALPGSVETVAKLVKDGFRFIAITSLSSDRQARAYRMENLKNLFGDVFDEVICLKTGSSKEHILARWADTGLIWIEDHFMNAEAGYECGLTPILVTTTTNEKYSTELFTRTSIDQPWNDIYATIRHRYNY